MQCVGFVLEMSDFRVHRGRIFADQLIQKMYKKLYAHRAEFKDFPFIEERYKDRLDKL
jgi:hypothetical protein